MRQGASISVIVRTLDRDEQLREALESLARQTRRDFEVVVVDMNRAGVAPLLESLGLPWDGILNSRPPAVFPLLPWAGYVYLGAAIGAATAEKGPRGAALWLLGLAGAACQK